MGFNAFEFKKLILSYNNNFDDKEASFLFDVYETVIDGMKEVYQNFKSDELTPINDYVVTLYIINEYKYAVIGLNQDEKLTTLNNSNFFDMLASICADKYLTNEQLNYKSQAFLNRFNPPISTLDLYFNFSLRTLDKIQAKDRNEELICDMLKKAFKMGKCILSLLINGFETEAFSTWRTLHENECILICLIKNGTNMFNEYFKHIHYALAYRGQLPSKEETDEVFVEIKKEMKEHELKSKDMKKFIEYGYLYATQNIENYPTLKLNFRDGVENVAGLSNYSKVYEMASEIAHSSPLLLYSKRSYFFEITILNLYESFFRLENIFDALYKTVYSEAEYNQYRALKNVYMRQLSSIYNIFKKSFLDKQVKKEEEIEEKVNNS